jgi:membrane-associated protease RseP (regulator of RpoE activity)
LPESTEAEFRALDPEEIGMLVAETVLPKGPGSAFLEEGDILTSVNGQKLSKFLNLEDILDSSVGKAVDLVFVRGGVEISCSIVVQDLHSITPDRFVSFGGGNFQTISYQLARQVYFYLANTTSLLFLSRVYFYLKTEEYFDLKWVLAG